MPYHFYLCHQGTSFKVQIIQVLSNLSVQNVPTYTRQMTLGFLVTPSDSSLIHHVDVTCFVDCTGIVLLVIVLTIHSISC